jgi:superfamily II DNA/RNA helicase
LGFDQPTEIQQAAIGAILQGRDVLAVAPTGSGKTLAFGLPLLQLLQPNMRRAGQYVRSLVLTPTRELAIQVGQSLQAVAKQAELNLKICTVHGGVSINPQMMALRGGADVVVATTGRLLDLVDHGALNLGEVAYLVLDEADRMLDLGFSQELNRIVQCLSAKRQSLFFSATFAPEVQALAHTLITDPVELQVQPQTQATPVIAQHAIEVDSASRTQLLKHLITQRQWSRVLVFVATKHAAEIVADKLRKGHIAAEPFHGLLSQGKRTQVLQDFKSERITAVVATDIAARGLDISDLPVVVNYDLPRSTDDYTHRIGRTARAGRSGMAVSFVTADTQAHFKLIERRQGIALEREQVAGFEPTQVAIPKSQAPAADPNGGVKGKRPSKKDKLRAMAASAAQQPKN